MNKKIKIVIWILLILLLIIFFFPKPIEKVHSAKYCSIDNEVYIIKTTSFCSGIPLSYEEEHCYSKYLEERLICGDYKSQRCLGLKFLGIIGQITVFS